MSDLSRWASILVCPLDHTPLDETQAGAWRCPQCHFISSSTVIREREFPDFRAIDRPQTVRFSVTIPVTPLDRYDIAKTMFRGNKQSFEDVPDKFSTKFDRGHRYYCLQILEEYGPEARVLELGCGNGDTKRYLETVGFRNVLSVDWSSVGADLLADAHRLPLTDESFQLVICTAVFQHLYNPFIAMSEIGRVLTDDGYFVGGGSFWEAWNGSSYFHFTPDGWHALFQSQGMSLIDLWPGWGIIPPALVHVITPGRFRRLGYGLQALVEWIYRLALGEQGVRRLNLRASGSYQVIARKQPKQG